MNFNPIQTNQRSVKEKLVQRIWELARVVLYLPTPFFMRGWRRFIVAVIARLYKRSDVSNCISKSASLSRTAKIDYPWNVSIGPHSSIGNNAWVYAMDNITIGENCCIGGDVRLVTGTHDINSATFDLMTRPIRIENDVWVATGAIVLPGVTVGEGAVVGAGAVVTKDVEPWTVVGGNPAKFIKERVLKDD